LTGSRLRKTTNYPKLALAAAITWTVIIFVACLWPGKELPHSDLPFIDKWTHFVLFGLFSLLWLLACPPPPGKPLSRLLAITLIAVALGALVEGLQTWLPALGRSGDLMDALADSLGGILGSAAFRLLPSGIFRVKEDALSG
jgi:VanZ family protein